MDHYFKDDQPFYQIAGVCEKESWVDETSLVCESNMSEQDYANSEEVVDYNFG